MRKAPDRGEAQDQDWLHGYDVGAQVGFLLRRAHQRHAALFAEAMGELDLTPTQFNALVRVVELGAVSQNQLGRLAAMDPATVQGVVRRLEERGLLQRGTDSGDRRTTVLAATEAGLKLAQRATVIGLEVTQATLAPLSSLEQQALLEALVKLG